MRLLKKCKTLRAGAGRTPCPHGAPGPVGAFRPAGAGAGAEPEQLYPVFRRMCGCTGGYAAPAYIGQLRFRGGPGTEAGGTGCDPSGGGRHVRCRTDKGRALRAAGADLEAIRAVAQRTVRARGYSYPVAVRLENMYFSTREYDGFTLPAGATTPCGWRSARMPGKLVLRAVSAHVRSRGNIRRRAGHVGLFRCGAAGCVQFL